MKNTLIFLSLLSTLVIASCSKSGETTNPIADKIPKTYTQDIRNPSGNSAITYNLTYDGNYNLLSMIAVPETAGKFIFQYPNNNSVIVDTYFGALLGIHELILLNASQFADSTIQIYATHDTTLAKYIYNANNLLLKSNYYDYHSSGITLTKTSVYNYDINGSVITQTDTPGGTITYTYYTKVNNFGLGNSFIPGPKFYLRSASVDSGGTPVTTMHYYNFDSNDRLIQDSITTSNTNTIEVKSYTY